MVWQRKKQVPGSALDIIVLFFALMLLISKIYLFVAGDGSGYEICKGLVATGVGFLMLYLSNKW